MCQRPIYISYAATGGLSILAYRDKKPAVIKPVDLFDGHEHDCVIGHPGPGSMNDFSFIKSVDSLCEGILVTVTNAADRWLDPGRLHQTLGLY